MGIHYQNHEHHYFSKITVNNCYPPHLHREIELFYCKKGSVKITIDGEESILSEGDLSICFPNLVHSIETEKESIAFLCIFSVDFLGAFEKELLESHPEDATLRQSQIPEECCYLLEQLEKQLSNPYDLRICRGYLTAFLGLLLPHYHLVKNQAIRSQDTYKLILDYIHRNFTQELNLSRLSKELGLSKYYISHIFSDKIGMSFNIYVNRVRVNYAVKLLSHPEYSITDICYCSGFNSIRTFYRAFHEVYHTSPLKFRRT